MSLITEWNALAANVRDTGLQIFATAEVPRTHKGFADVRVLALTLLARTISKVKGAMILLDAMRIVEARTITRCCFENLFWAVGLIEEGEAFVGKMRDDDVSHRKALGQSIFGTEIQLEEDVEARLRAFMKDINKRSSDTKMLLPKHVAQIRKDFEKMYIFYGQLSGDSAHPSVTALKRYVVPDTDSEEGGIDVEPVVSERELAETYEYLCMTSIGLCVAVNQIIGGTAGGAALNGIADRYADLSDRTKAQFKRAA
jgi:hypothetical protein